MKSFRLLTFFLILLSSCSFDEPIAFKKINNVVLTGLNDETITLTAEALFYNPNKTSGKLKSIELDVLLNDRLLSHISQDSRQTVNKQSTFTIPFTARFATEAIQESFVSSIFTLLSGKKLKLHFVGEIKVGVLGFTQTVPVDYYAEVKL